MPGPLRARITFASSNSTLEDLCQLLPQFRRAVTSLSDMNCRQNQRGLAKRSGWITTSRQGGSLWVLCAKGAAATKQNRMLPGISASLRSPDVGRAQSADSSLIFSVRKRVHIRHTVVALVPSCFASLRILILGSLWEPPTTRSVISSRYDWTASYTRVLPCLIRRSPEHPPRRKMALHRTMLRSVTPKTRAVSKLDLPSDSAMTALARIVLRSPGGAILAKRERKRRSRSEIVKSGTAICLL
jgi:hypothetical protein